MNRYLLSKLSYSALLELVSVQSHLKMTIDKGLLESKKFEAIQNDNLLFNQLQIIKNDKFIDCDRGYSTQLKNDIILISTVDNTETNDLILNQIPFFQNNENIEIETQEDVLLTQDLNEFIKHVMINGITVKGSDEETRYKYFAHSKKNMYYISDTYYDACIKRCTLHLQSTTGNHPFEHWLKDSKLSLPKWTKYLSLCLSDGEIIQNDQLDLSKIIVVDDCTIPVEYFMPHYEKKTVNSSPQLKYKNKEKTRPINCFDGMGIISPEYAKRINETIAKDGHKSSSFVIRLPFVKGTIHTVDFKKYFNQDCWITGHTKEISDCFGKIHNIDDVEIILTKSMFKAVHWWQHYFEHNCNNNKNNTAWDEYINTIQNYNHKLLVTLKDPPKDSRESKRIYNYQVIATAGLQWKTFQEYIKNHTNAINNISTNHAEKKRIISSFYDKNSVYDSHSDYHNMALAVKLEEQLIYTKPFDNKIKQHCTSLSNSARIGKIKYKGDYRFLTADIMSFLKYLALLDKTYNQNKSIDPTLLYQCFFNRQNKSACYQLMQYEYFAPGLTVTNKEQVIFRNPHIILNEYSILQPYNFAENKHRKEDILEDIYKKYFSHLTGILMTNPVNLAFMRMQGADYDGDGVQIIDDKEFIEDVKNTVNEEFKELSKNHPELNNILKKCKNRLCLPLIQDTPLPVESKTKDEIGDLNSLNGLIADNSIATSNLKVGQYTNFATSLAINYYSAVGKTNRDDQEKLIALAIAIGHEIDSVKTGIKQPLPKELKVPKKNQPLFMQYIRYYKYNNKNNNLMPKNSKFKNHKINNNEITTIYKPVITAIEDSLKNNGANAPSNAVESYLNALPYYINNNYKSSNHQSLINLLNLNNISLNPKIKHICEKTVEQFGKMQKSQNRSSNNTSGNKEIMLILKKQNYRLAKLHYVKILQFLTSDMSINSQNSAAYLKRLRDLNFEYQSGNNQKRKVLEAVLKISYCNITNTYAFDLLTNFQHKGHALLNYFLKMIKNNPLNNKRLSYQDIIIQCKAFESEQLAKISFDQTNDLDKQIVLGYLTTTEQHCWRFAGSRIVDILIQKKGRH